VSFPTYDKAALLLLPLPVVPHRITLAVRDMDGGLAQFTAIDKPDRDQAHLPARCHAPM